MRSKLEEDEKPLIVVHKHWVVLLQAALMLLLSLVFYVYALYMSLNPKVAFIICSCCFFYFIYRIYERKYDIWIVTNKRIIDEWGVFSHNAKETPLDRIQNINYHQSIIGRILNYGDVEIETAAIEGKTTNFYVSSPVKLREAVISAREQMQQEKAKTEDERHKEDVKECPYCANLIKAKAKFCMYCQKELEEVYDE